MMQVSVHRSLDIYRVSHNRNFNFSIEEITMPLVIFKKPPAITGPVSTGGIITTQGDDKIHTFRSSGNFQVVSGSGNVEYLVVAGGGSGGPAQGPTNTFAGAGGGAGGFKTNATKDYAVTAGAYTVTIGAGGAATQTTTNNGSDSVFDTITSLGGGFGAYGPDTPFEASNGGNGGSGGGSSNVGTAGTGSGGPYPGGQGSNGGIGTAGTGGSAGGGGAGAVGEADAGAQAGAGGVGVATIISGQSTLYAGGGGSGGYSLGSVAAGAGGTGGGGDGGDQTVGTAGADYFGGGGGGGGPDPGPVSGGNGGSGVVVVRYLSTNPAFTSWNPTDKSSGAVLTNDELTFSDGGGSNYESARGRAIKTSGKYYWEVTVDVLAAGDLLLGIADNLKETVTGVDPTTGGTFVVLSSGGSAFASAGITAAAPSTTAVSDVRMFALDLDNDQMWYGKNGTWDSGNPSTLTSPSATSLTEAGWFPFVSTSTVATETKVTANFGAGAFAHSVPTGFTAGWTS